MRPPMACCTCDNNALSPIPCRSGVPLITMVGAHGLPDKSPSGRHCPPEAALNSFLARSPLCSPNQELHELVDEADGAGALRAIAEHVCAFRHPARMAYIRGMAAAAQRAGFAASHEAFTHALRELPNALEPEVRCAWAGQLGQLGAQWHALIWLCPI